MVFSPLTLAILLIVSVFTFILSNVVWDLFGLQIKQKFSSILPSGVSTDQGFTKK
jgi:hypothetical protein